MGIYYCTRESVKGASQVKFTARMDAQVDDAIDAGARAIEGRLHRRFYPWTGTRYFDWPDENARGTRTWRLRLGEDELVSLASLTAGGVAIAVGDVNLEPRNSGPPFRRIECDLSTAAAFSSGDTHQQAIAATGVFGFDANTRPAGALAEGLDASETDVDVTNSALVGVGDILVCESERMIVTGKTMLDTTINLTAGLTTAADNDVTGTVSGAGLAVGEVLLIDSERLLLVDQAGTTITVKRAWDGTVLATHSTEDVYALRTLTVERGALGTAAAAHNTATALTKVEFPSLIRTLNRAEALNTLQQEGAAWARTAGSGESEREMSGKGLESLWKQALTRYGRSLRSGSV